MSHRLCRGVFSSCLAIMCLATPLKAAVVPSLLFSDHAVLQRDKPIPVWGTADSAEKVSVSFSGHTVATTADESGAWRVDLPALPANATPGNLVITGKNIITLKGIVVGEVWLASGQSNMEMMVHETHDAALYIPGSARYPMIRHFRPEYTVSETPLRVGSGTWKVAGPQTTGEFTAIGYYFALSLYEVLNVPVGIINNSRGGSHIRGWMDPLTLATDPDISDSAKAWAAARASAKSKYPALKSKLDAEITAWEASKASAKTANKPFNAPRPSAGWAGMEGGPDDQFMPSGLYNGMIRPLEPFALRGVIWYQGEANSGQHVQYAKVFPAMITGWRRQFAQGDFPFYWVQLSGFNDPAGVNMAFLREAQAKTLSLPATGQAVSIDVGDRGNIHPARKSQLGRRLARIALARTYDQKIIDRGPVFKKAEREGAGYRVSFTEGASQHRLATPFNTLDGFELAGSDRIFKPALAEIGKDQATVLVTSVDVPEPIAVRYAWRDSPMAGLFNREGLPAEPFRSDDWDK